MGEAALAAAARRVCDGALVAYPTETVWGLGADAASELALGRLRSWKQRSVQAPISILVCEPDDLERLGFEPDVMARALADRFWPGPLTLVLPCRRRFAHGVARADGAVGVRCSPHPVAAGLARWVARLGGGPLTATSLNPGGGPAARTREEAKALCASGASGDGGETDPHLVDVDGADAGRALPSTVLDLTGARADVLRWGAVPERALSAALQEIRAS